MKNPFERWQKAPAEPNKEKSEDELTLEEMCEKLHDPAYLPSHAVLSKHLENFKGFEGIEHPLWNKWNDLACNDENPIFEIWTEEYINALADYLAERVQELGGTEENPVVILEVGAGNGRLTHFLKEKIHQTASQKVKVIASDSGLREIAQNFPVENLSHTDALAVHRPRIVIFSWMPSGEDYTADFRSIPEVDEYILIGETDGGCSGNDETWGRSTEFYADDGEVMERELPAYEVDGFEKIRKEVLSDLQLSRADIVEGKRTTATVSFKRKKT